MKNLTFTIGILLLALNLLLGWIISGYASFNVWANCAVIIVNVIFIWTIASISLKDGFRISYNILFPIICIIEFLSIAFSRPTLEDNGAIVFVLLAILLQCVLLLAANHVSKSIK